jgi:hypothetical protein
MRMAKMVNMAAVQVVLAPQNPNCPAWGFWLFNAIPASMGLILTQPSNQLPDAQRKQTQPSSR